MRKTIEEFKGEDGYYRFPDTHTALQYIDEMSDDDWFIIENKADSDLLARLKKLFP